MTIWPDPALPPINLWSAPRMSTTKYYHGEYVLLITEQTDYAVSWRIVAVSGRDTETGEPVYMNEGELSTLEDAENAAAGCIKWDGCSDWGDHFCYAHFCDAEQITSLAAAMVECYRITAEICPNWDDR